MSKNSTKKIYKEPAEVRCAWEVASDFIKKGYSIVSLDKKGGQVYCDLRKEQK